MEKNKEIEQDFTKLFIKVAQRITSLQARITALEGAQQEQPRVQQNADSLNNEQYQALRLIIDNFGDAIQEITYGNRVTSHGIPLGEKSDLMQFTRRVGMLINNIITAGGAAQMTMTLTQEQVAAWNVAYKELKAFIIPFLTKTEYTYQKNVARFEFLKVPIQEFITAYEQIMFKPSAGGKRRNKRSIRQRKGSGGSRSSRSTRRR